MASSEPKPSKSRSKDKRKRPQLHQQDETLDQQQAPAPKRTKSSSPWANLDLILSLQRNDLDIQRKVELASEFISSDVGISDARRQPVSASRLASFLTDWIQPLLIPREKSSGLCVHCLDFRCWTVLRFCLKNSQFAVSLNLLKSAAQVFKYSEGSADGKRLFESVLECFELLLSANPRAFYNASMDLWRPCVVEIVGSVHRCSGNGDHDVVLRLSNLLLGHFVNFLRFHKDPTNIFSKFVDGLLEPLLELLVLLHLRTKGGICGQFGSLLRLVEDVLSNGLFHPTNIGGFFSLKSSIAEQKTWAPKGHREFFKKLGNIITEKKAMVLRGFGYLFRLFVTSAKSQKIVSLAAKSDQALAKNSETSDERKETSKPLFEVFVQFMQPLVLECKRCSEKELSKSEEGLEDRLLEAHGMLKSLNETLVSFIQEKIYIRTEDTSDGGHYNFLKEVYGTIVLISGKIYQLWLSTLDMDGGRVKKMLPLVAREVVAAVGYFLEIEYKVVGDDLVKLWVMMVSFLAVYLSVEDTQPSSPLTSDILNLGYRLINIYSELRQVNSPLFALCKAARLLNNPSSADASDYSMFVSSLSSHIYIKSVGTLLCSQEIQVAISNAIKSIPEGQASGCVQQLEVDMEDSLQWIKFNPFGSDGENVTETYILNASVTYLDMQTEVLGRLLSEVYSTVLDSLTITATNSISVGNSIKNLMGTVGLSFINLVQRQSGSVDEFILSVTGRRLCDHEKSETESGKCIKPLSISWILVFFFRMYISCRSLYRQLISHMPPVSAVKAAKSMGSSFIVAHEGDWRERPKFMDEGYFSWIVKPSISLLDLIKFHLEDFVSSTGCPSLHYVIYIMALQRLNDLNRLIQAFEFLQRKDVNESNEKWKRLILLSKQEATEMANFLLRSGKLLDHKGHLISVKNDELDDTKASYEHAWDLGVCSLNQRSLHIAIWRLLCRNIDIWCVHAAKKYLKKFLSCLFFYSIQDVKCSGEVRIHSVKGVSYQKVTMHHVSMEFLANIVSYEQSPLCKHFTSGFGRVLEELLVPALSNVCANKMDLGSLPDWSEFLRIVKKEPLIGLDDGIALFDHSSLLPNSNLVLQEAKNVDLNDRETSFMLKLRTCESLLTLFSTIPKVQLDAKSFSVYAAYSLNLERLAVSCLLKNGTNSSLCKPYELVRLFISCRRVMKSLVSSSLDGNCGPTDSASISSVFGSSGSILWLFESVSEIVGLPHALFGVTYSSWLQDVIFPLIDHTSYIFLAISEKQMSAIKDFKINEKKLLTEHSVDIMSEILKDQARNLFTSMGSLQEIKPEDCVRVLGCSRLAVIISCFQGFLWGLVSAIDSINQDVSTVNPQYSRLIPACLPILCECITLFEEILNLCFNLLTSSQATVVICSTGYHDNKGNSPSECAFSESPFCKEKDMLPLDTAGKANLVNQVQETNLSKLKNLKGPLLESPLKGEDPQIAYTLGKLFTASAAILKLKGMLRFPRSLGSKVSYSKVAVNPIFVLETSVLILKEMAEMVGRMEPVSFVCLDGILTFLEAVGSSNGDPNLSEDFYTQIIDTHIRAIGKCISLQGKSATLYSHESGSSSKMLRSHNELNRNGLQMLDEIKLRLNAFKVRLSISFKKFIQPKKFDLMIALQLLERALVGAQHDRNTVYDLTTGTLDGGEVSSTVAAGLNCLELVLESLSGHELVVGKTFSFINAVFNIILHLQNPTIFYVEKQLNYKTDNKPDAGSVILMCVQILASIAGNKSIQLEAWHVSQCLHIPLALFTGFQQLKDSFPSSDATTFFDNWKMESSRDMCCDIVDRKFSVELYASCCRLLCTTLNHRQHHTEQCVAILEESVSTLLNCLEMVDTDLIRGKCYFSWESEEAIKCASYLRRIYEEIRNEKDVFVEHSSYFLSNYISMYSGCGPLKGGIKREVDEALRPGVYSLIDVCRKSDFKRLHTSFGEGPCRSTLKTLLHDFNVNFKYKGKI